MGPCGPTSAWEGYTRFTSSIFRFRNVGGDIAQSVARRPLQCRDRRTIGWVRFPVAAMDLIQSNRVKITVQTRLRRYCRPPCTHARITSWARRKNPYSLEGGWIWKHEYSHAGKRKKMGGATLCATRFPRGRQPECLPSLWRQYSYQIPNTKYQKYCSTDHTRQ